jgi:putative tryptophan/tyrosine transport system substrate-binding protein
MASHIGRRKFLATLGGAAAAWPLAARAQQAAMPVIGFFHSGSPSGRRPRLAAFHAGLGEAGYVEGQNVAIEYRWAENRYERLPALATDLVQRRVALIATPASIYAVLAAKAATSTIPIVFGVGDDPVKLGLVASLNRPGGNATGVNYFTAYLGPKRLGLLHEPLPRGGVVAVLVNPNNPVANSAIAELRAPAAAVGRTVEIFRASNGDEINRAFRAMAERKAGGLVVVPDTSLTNHMIQIVTLAARHAMPTIFESREWAEAGGLMSYGANIQDVYRQVGAYAGRILKGAKPDDLPVEQSTKFEFVVNLQTAKAFDLEIPPTLAARADEVIE